MSFFNTFITQQKQSSKENKFCMYETQPSLIRFPTITKLLYTGNSQQNEELPRKASLSMNKLTKNSSYQPNMFSTVYHKEHAKLENKHFNLVQLPLGTDVMGISSMNMIQRQIKSTSLISAAKNLQNSDQSKKEQETTKNHKRQSKQKIMSLVKNKSHANLTGINFSVGRKFTKSQSSFGGFTVQKKINYADTYSQLITLMGLVHGIVVEKKSSRGKRAKIELGNNGLLIKQTIKKRSWWNITKQNDQINSISLVWTEHEIKNKQKVQYQREQLIRKGEIQKGQKSKFFEKNFGQTLSYYPRILQLFFTSEQQIPKKLSDWINKLPSPQRYINQSTILIYNHLSNNEQITNKKMLFQNLSKYFQKKQMNTFDYIPRTYHITAFNWQEVVKIIKINELKKKGEKTKKQTNQAWFIKPGENSNRGRGITFNQSIQDALNYIIKYPPKQQKKSYILQKYITPILYERRKFDIRCFMLGIRVYEHISFYWYEEGYIRTATEKFSFNKTSRKIHLTNDAVQKNMQGYGQHEQGNKLSYSELQKYLKNVENLQFSGKILPQMKKISTHIAAASADKLGNLEGISFELFGLDFIIDEKGKPFLLEVNTNPSLQICSNLISRIISEVIENTFRLVVDVIFPYPKNTPDWAQNFILQNKFSLIYREKTFSYFA